jgi:hypothetical protein
MTSLSPHAILLVYWLLMAALAAFFLRMACGLCRMTLPSWRRAIVSVLLVTFLAYVAFDFTSYLVLRSMDGVSIVLPPWYGYHLWFREPLGLKLFVISHAGPLRYLPYVFGLCAAGVLQVIVLQAQVTFRMGLVVFALQWFATFVAGYLVGLLFGVGLSAIGWNPEQPPVAAAPDQTQKQARARQQAGRRGREAPGGRQAAGAAGSAKGRQQTGGEETDSSQGSLQMIEQEVGEAARSTGERLRAAGESFKEYAESHLEEVKEDLAPVVDRLPEPVQRFLDKGGWWVLFGALAVIILVWLRALLRRLARALPGPRRRRRQRAKKVAVKLKENLNRLGETHTDPGPKQITVKGLPARLRLVILSLGSSNAGELHPEMVDRVLDWIKPGLAEVTSGDYPRVRVWPFFPSFSGFEKAFASNVRIPEPKGEQSRWVLVCGRVKMGKAIINVGLGLYADEESTLRNLTVKGEKWADAVGAAAARHPAGAW